MSSIVAISPERAAGFAMVLGVHAAALWGLWQHRLLPAPEEATTLFVNFITPPPPRQEKPQPVPPRPTVKTPPRIIAAAPLVTPDEPVAPPPPPQATAIEAPVAAVAPPAPPRPAGPVTLGGELAVACPERTPPRYPPPSRRFGEQGTVVLRVELDEQGRISAAHVASSSGFTRLDDAALAAVRNWRCSPATRDGQAVRAIASQPFNFVLQGS